MRTVGGIVKDEAYGCLAIIVNLAIISLLCCIIMGISDCHKELKKLNQAVIDMRGGDR